MQTNAANDSNAIALSMFNFGNLPPMQGTLWMQHFARPQTGNCPMPQKAIVELANTCNLDCPMCRVGQFGINLKRILPLPQFRDMLEQLKGVQIIRLNGLGESTLIPGFHHYLKELFDRHIVVELISNGSGELTHYTNILRNNGAVLISFDAAEKHVFERLRRPARWELYADQLNQLGQFARQNQLADRLFILFTLQKLNINQLPLLVELSAKWGIRNIIVNVVKLEHNNWLQEAIPVIQETFLVASKLAKKNEMALLLPDEIAGQSMNISNALRTSAHNCRMPWEEVVIRWNGDVQVCNMFNPYTYGNIFLNKFSDIWNNAFAKLFRQFINTENRHPYCRDCVYIKNAYDYRKT